MQSSSAESMSVSVLYIRTKIYINWSNGLNELDIDWYIMECFRQSARILRSNPCRKK